MFVIVLFFRFGEDRKSAAAWEWGYLQTSLWDYWSVLFRRWCKFYHQWRKPPTFNLFSLLRQQLTLLWSVLFRLMKIPAWSLTPLKEGPSTLILLPTCKQRSLISESQGVWFSQLHGYSPQTNHHRHSSISPTWQSGTEGFTYHHFNNETHYWRIYPPPPLHCGVFLLFCFCF